MQRTASARTAPTEDDRVVTGEVSSELALGRLAGWYAIVLRVGSAVACAVAGPLAATTTVSGYWLSAHSHVVPAAAISAGTTWMLPLASTAVLIPQLAFRPAFSLPMGSVVAVAYSLTV